ncbi:uncharacterized protein BDW43DRAFT_316716 [Aspergillus alliaceus]|uniref:uncharacterized protein n=1 Tax=Petromyces alliaceus TaxID=209559 RepID=UPI0012A6B74C|nr:uncharacterized protein BDW43DRAFT_316716 [Aspergillus alliaceus]KAB8227542.1 hypothetical protein BDW43DRAFT_316716 [Aspergillus alliaceus]
MEDLIDNLLVLEDKMAAESLEILFEKNMVNNSFWEYLDKGGNNLLHLMGLQSMPSTVSWILGQQKGLAEKKNSRGETPFDALQARLENARTLGHISYPPTGDSSGFSDASVSCLLQLARISVNSDQKKSCLKFGCTCCECAFGFLSPRMCLVLEWYANRWACFLRDDIGEGETWTRLNAANLIFTSCEIQRELAKRRAMREGFAAVAGFIAACLRCHIIPTEENVREVILTSQEWPPICEDYLLRGGTVSAVACIIFRDAAESDNRAECSQFQDENEETIVQLPICRNDHEFGLVRAICGYADISRISHFIARSNQPQQTRTDV